MISVRPTRAIAKNGTPAAQASGTALEVRFARTELSRQRRQLMRAILDNPKEAYFLSSRELARWRPSSLTGFASIRGVGQKKLEDLGPEFLTRIRSYCEAHGLGLDAR